MKRLIFEEINYDDNFKLNIASSWQIIMAMHKSLDLISQQYEFTERKKILYPVLRTIINDISLLFRNILENCKNEDILIFRKFLGGDRLGKLKRPVMIKYHNRYRLGKTKFYSLLQGLIKRITYIAFKKMPIFYENTENIKQSFLNLQEFLKPFLIKLNEHNDTWLNLCASKNKPNLV